MPERPPYEADEVMDYLLGQITPAARQQFEMRLESDAALREYVRELEQGVVALGMTAPARDVPPEIWPRIEPAVARQVRRETWFPFLRPGWQVSGWAAAGVAGLVLIAQWFWFHAGNVKPPQARVANTEVVRFSQTKPAQTEESGAAELPSPPKILPMETPEESVLTAELRQKVARLEAQLARLSQTAPQTPPAVAATVANPPRSLQFLPPTGMPRGTKNMSPQLQQAVLLAVARKMGWTLNPPTSDAATGASQDNAPAVDFVDLNAPANVVANALPTMAATTPLATTPDSVAFSTTPPSAVASFDAAARSANGDPGGASSSVSMLAWGNTIMAAIDPTTLPTNSGPVSVWQMDNDGNGQVLGTVAVGSNPTVINFASDPSQSYFVTVGGTNVIGQFPAGH